MNLRVENVYGISQSRDSTKEREKKRQQNLTSWQQEFQKATRRLNFDTLEPPNKH